MRLKFNIYFNAIHKLPNHSQKDFKMCLILIIFILMKFGHKWSKQLRCFDFWVESNWFNRLGNCINFILTVKPMQPDQSAQYQPQSSPQTPQIRHLRFRRNQPPQPEISPLSTISQESSHYHHESQNIQSDSEPKNLRYYNLWMGVCDAQYLYALQKADQQANMQKLKRKVQSLKESTKQLKDNPPAIKQKASNQNAPEIIPLTADQFDERFKCQVPRCERSYGSKTSLSRHIKLKHPELNPKTCNQDSKPSKTNPQADLN